MFKKCIKLNCILIFISVLTIFITSCSNQFDPRAYNRRKKIGNDNNTISTNEPDINIPSENDPFKYPQNNDINDKDFDGNVFNTWFITAKFLSGNIPEYKFLKEYSSPWHLKDANTKEYRYIGPDTTAASGSLNPSFTPTYYKYKGKNHKYAYNGKYNTGAHGERMERFYFYRFTGTAVGVSLDNALIAIDKYTKLAFAYAKPVSFGSFGNPTSWKAIDEKSEYKFYEYDPVGIVSNDGSVELYDWFKNNLKAGNYEPFLGDLTRDVANYNKPGRSPYFYISAEGLFLDMVKGKTYRNRDDKDSLTLHIYEFSEDGKTLIYKTQNWKKNPVVVASYTYSDSIDNSSANYGSDVFSIEENGLKLNKNRVYIGRTDFNDPGPTFIDRVKGSKYTSLDKAYSYEFSADGKTIIYIGRTGKKTKYTYNKQRDNVKAAYWEEGALVFGYWAVLLSENDVKIQMSTAALASADDILNSASYGYDAYLSSGGDIVVDQFLIRVQGRTFAYRDTANSLLLHKYKFSPEGESITYEKLEWRNPTPVEKRTFGGYTKIDDENATYDGVRFSIIDNGNKLHKEGVFSGDYNYKDPGPIFLERVKDNPKFSGGAEYEFKDNGKTLIVDGYTYTFYRNDKDDNYRNRAIYKYNWAQYYGIELSNEDETIKMTRSSSADAILWTSLGWDASRK